MTYQYTYDKMDNILTRNTEHGTYQYGYDDIYRLASAESPTLNAESYTYDPVGNRLTSDGVQGDWTYNDNNELSGYDDVSYIYDDNGNMIQKTVEGVVTNFVYNVEDRLIEVRDGSDSLIASYYYDPFGRRLWKEVDGVRRYFLYSDEGLIGEYDSGGIEIRSYGYVPGSTWTTDPLFMKQRDDYYFYQNDHLGTPMKMTGVNGAVVWQATYSSFGEARIGFSSTITNNLRFPGQYFDQETGLHHNYNRYYDPNGGRFLRSDPSHHLNRKSRFLVPFLVENPQELNDYTYARNNPLTYFDVLGLNSEQCCYIYDWKCKECIEWGPKELDLDCFNKCIADHFADYVIGGIAAALMFKLGHPILGGIVVTAGVHHIYAECYLPCKKCPMATVVNF